MPVFLAVQGEPAGGDSWEEHIQVSGFLVDDLFRVLSEMKASCDDLQFALHDESPVSKTGAHSDGAC
jgi:hypothetical protein